jgi:energy-coupling factor transport system permease protein
VHRLDARLKLGVALAVVPVLFLVDGWAGLAVVGAGFLTLIAIAHVPFGYLLRGLGPLVVILALTFVFQAIGYPGTTWIALGPLTITYEGVEAGAFLAVRLFLLLVSGMALTLTTPPVSLTDALEWGLRPLGRIRVPTAEIALMMTIALRFIPTLLRELDDILKAQRARGVDLAVRDPVRLVQALLPIMVPLFVLSFRRADDLAVAMTSRGYRGGQGRTRYRELRFDRLDAVAALLLAAWLMVALTAGRFWSVGSWSS